MKIAIFLFPNRYRSSCMPWGDQLKLTRYDFLIRVTNRFVFKVVSWLLLIRFIEFLPFDIYVSDPVYNYRSKNIYSIWWNNERELGRDQTENDLFVCRLPVNHRWLFILPNLESVARNRTKNLNEVQVVYFGEAGSYIRSRYKSSSDSIRNIRLTNSIDQSGDQIIDPNEKVLAQELIRYRFLRYLDDNIVNLNVYGSDWSGIIRQWLASNYDQDFRISAYSGNICLDFGSKCSLSCLYHRPIEVLLSGGILFHRKAVDSIDIFGDDYCNYFCFETELELLTKISSFLEHSEPSEFHYQMLLKTPLFSGSLKFDSGLSELVVL